LVCTLNKMTQGRFACHFHPPVIFEAFGFTFKETRMI
jgi:hypothetical protein